MYQLEVSLCHALNSNNLFLRYPAGSIYIFSDLKEIKTAGKERTLSDISLKRNGRSEERPATGDKGEKLLWPEFCPPASNSSVKALTPKVTVFRDKLLRRYGQRGHKGVSLI